MTPRRHPVFARAWDLLAPTLERHGAAEQRQRLLGDVGGRVVEIGAGTGSNLAHYPAGVTEVVAVEPEPRLRARAGEAGAGLRFPVALVDAVAERLPFPDAAFDAAVATLVLCSVPDLGAALAELRRVLRPAGRLFFWEHVRAEQPRLARVQRLLDATVWPAISGGCHAARDTTSAIAAAGFTIERLERFRLPAAGPTTPMSPMVVGTARAGR